MTNKKAKEIAALVLRFFGTKERWRKNAKCDWAIRQFIGRLGDLYKASNPRFRVHQFWRNCGY